ncbi:MAG: iron dicitrate transport regulator FecR, partial [Rhodoferax sp.]|nr:iron dicitrate transport regulator FecR [Rhodoferax sp.]
MRSNPPASRPESEWLWFQRRQVLQAAAGWLALGGAAGAWAQERSNVVERVGDVLLNGQPLRDGDSVRVGDELQTGPGSRLTVVVDGVALHLRAGSRLRIEARESSPLLLGTLRLITGAMGSAWSAGPVRR